MRSKEQFKAYVYEKADAARIRNKKHRAIALRGAAVFSLFVVVGGVMLYGNVTNDAATSPEAIPMEDTESAQEYGASVAKSDMQAVLDSEEVVAEINAAAKGSTSGAAVQYSYSSDYTSEMQDGGVHSALTMDTVGSITYTIAESADAYKGDLKNIDFDKNVALVLEDCGSVLNSKIEYTDASIVVTVTIETEESETLPTYTILLNKSKYKGQPVAVVFD